MVALLDPIYKPFGSISSFFRTLYMVRTLRLYIIVQLLHSQLFEYTRINLVRVHQSHESEPQNLFHFLLLG